MELDKILDEMESIVMEASHVPVVDKIMLDEGEINMAMDKLRAAVPLEVKRAHDLLEEQKNIIANSRTEADHIVEQAKAEAERIVEMAKAEADRLARNEEIVKMAEEKANGIIENTQQYDRDMRAAADAYAEKLHKESIQYASDVFSYLEENLNKTLQAVKENGDAIRSSEDNSHDNG